MFLGKLKTHRLKILGGVLLVLIFAGAVFGAYRLGQRQIQPAPIEGPTPAISPKPTLGPDVYHTPGMDFIINKALKVEREANKDLLVLNVTFIGNDECPWPEGTVCQYDTRAFRLIDEEGFIQDMLFTYPQVELLTTDPISQRALKPGEKDRGDVFFEIPKDRKKFFLTYGKEMTEEILIEPELFDPECTKAETGEKMSLSEAREVAQESDCVEEGDLTETYSCNESTGTWWLGLDIEKEGCVPACVVDISTGEAEINWRCTGFGPQE